MKAGRLWVTILTALWISPAAWGQRAAQPPSAASPAAAGQAASQPPARAPAPVAPLPAPAGRRDPFQSIVVKKEAAKMPDRLPPGKKGLVIGQLQIQGIVSGIRGEWIAVVDNKTKRAYFLREKDELYNGVVSRITPDGVVFLENVTDSLGRTHSREVVKRLPAE